MMAAGQRYRTCTGKGGSSRTSYLMEDMLYAREGRSSRVAHPSVLFVISQYHPRPAVIEPRPK